MCFFFFFFCFLCFFFLGGVRDRKLHPDFGTKRDARGRSGRDVVARAAGSFEWEPRRHCVAAAVAGSRDAFERDCPASGWERVAVEESRFGLDRPWRRQRLRVRQTGIPAVFTGQCRNPFHRQDVGGVLGRGVRGGLCHKQRGRRGSVQGWFADPDRGGTRCAAWAGPIAACGNAPIQAIQVKFRVLRKAVAGAGKRGLRRSTAGPPISRAIVAPVRRPRFSGNGRRASLEDQSKLTRRRDRRAGQPLPPVLVRSRSG